jgi:glycerate 2-kinase
VVPRILPGKTLLNPPTFPPPVPNFLPLLFPSPDDLLLEMRATLDRAVVAALRAADPVQAFRATVSVAGGTLGGGKCTVSLPGLATPLDLTSVPCYYVYGAGKASVPLAAETVRALTQAGLECGGGVVVTKYAHAGAEDVGTLEGVGVVVRESGHPVPDEAGIRAAQEVLACVRGQRRGAAVFVCLTGGASALLPLPSPGITLAHLSALTQALLASGAPIAPLNAVRKHCSELSGGRLGQAILEAGASSCITLAVSDVQGDSLGVIGSGPTHPDSSTFQDALDALQHFGVAGACPPSILGHLTRGVQGLEKETPKELGGPATATAGATAGVVVHSVILASNGDAVKAAAQALEGSHRVVVLPRYVDGEAVVEAQGLMEAVLKEAQGMGVGEQLAVIAGGEAIVTLGGEGGGGKGGRNSEAALAFALGMSRKGEGVKGVLDWTAA